MKKQGAELAFTYQMEKHKGRVEKLAVHFDSTIVLPCDVCKMTILKSISHYLKNWGNLIS